MMDKLKDFIKKNFTWYHLIGIVFCVAFAVVYWYKKGQYSDKILQSNLILMIVWGILIGYIFIDMVFNAKNRKDKEE